MSSSSVSEAVSSDEDSQARMNWVSDCRREGTVRCVCDEEVECEFELPARELGLESAFENEAEAAAEAKDESAVGATGSGITVLRNVSQGRLSSKGLTLRSRSPRPSSVEAGLQDSRNELEGRGPSVMVRRPILRSGGKPTAWLSALLSKLSKPSWRGAAAESRLLYVGASVWGLRERVRSEPSDVVLRRRESLWCSASALRDAVAGAKSGVRAGRGRELCSLVRGLIWC